MQKILPLIIYRLLWSIAGVAIPLILHWRVLRKKEDPSRIKERYGYPSRTKPKGDLYWIHSASVGESISALVLAKALLKQNQTVHILITSGTLTSAQLLKKRIQDKRIIHQFHPHDHQKWVARFLNHWRPKLAVMVEGEIWPNMITLSADRGIPIALASAQISVKSAQFWSGLGTPLARVIFPLFDRIITVDEEQKNRFENFSLRPQDPQDVVVVGGSMKIASPPLDDNPSLGKAITKAAKGRKIILLASSHEGEEEFFLNAMAKLDSEKFYTIIAPRHIHRGKVIKKMLTSKNIRAGQHQGKESPAPHQQAWIADMMGEMGCLISAGDIIVLGGAFGNLGGHNPMEMAALSKGVISGQNTFKNTAAFDLLNQHGGVITASTSGQLARAIKTLTEDKTARQNLNQGAGRAYKKGLSYAGKTAKLLIALTLKPNRNRRP